MALSESAIKRNRQANKRKRQRLGSQVKQLMNPNLRPMGPIGGGSLKVLLDSFRDPDYKGMFELEEDRIESDQGALRNNYGKEYFKNKGSSAKKKTKKKKPRGVGIASRGYGKAMR